MSKAKGLPTRAPAFDRMLDDLVEPPQPGRGDSDPRGTSGASTARKAAASLVGAGDSPSVGTSGVRGTSDTSRGPSPRQHIKVRSDLAAELRGAVWFLSEHGRPRVQLGELIDEAVENWLTEARRLHNGEAAFPDRGPLR